MYAFMKRQKRIHSLFWVLFIFYLLFSPPIRGIHSLYLVSLFSWIYIIINYKQFCRTVSFFSLFSIYLVLILLFVWAFLLVALNDGSRSVVIHYIYWVIAVFPACLCVNTHVKKNNMDLVYLLRLVLIAAFIQSLISIIAFLNNDIKLRLISLLESDNTLVMSSYTNEIYYRLFGFSAGLTFDMPCTMALIACIGVYLAINYNIRYLLFVPSIIFSAIINARTSAVVFGIGIVMLILMKGNFSFRSVLRIGITVVIVFLGVGIGGRFLSQVSPLTYNWFQSGMNQILGFFNKQTDSGYFGYMLDADRWILPQGISLLFGTGSRIMGGSRYGVFSDVGYINDIWFGGLLYCIFLYGIVALCLLFSFIFSHNHEHTKLIQFITAIYMISFPILNIKTYIISFGTFTTLLILVELFVFTDNSRLSLEKRNCCGLSYFCNYSRV